MEKISGHDGVVNASSRRLIAPMLIAAAATTGLWATTFVDAATFFPTRDTFIDGHSSERNFGSGKEPSDRIGKTTEESYLVDFDSVAIKAFMDANPLGVNEVYEARLHLRPRDNFPVGGLSIPFGTLNLAVDWVEGDGTGTTSFDWTAGTKDATDNFAQHAWMLDPDAVTKITDTANSVKWTGADSTEYDRYFLVPLGIMNSEPFTATSADHNLHVSVLLDDAVLDDLVNNPTNRGLSFRNATNTLNARVYGLEETAARRPFLEINIVPVPEPASLGLMSLGGLMLLRRRSKA